MTISELALRALTQRSTGEIFVKIAVILVGRLLRWFLHADETPAQLQLL